MKKFFTITKYLWIGGIMGVLQQLLGELDAILYQGSNRIFSFSEIMGALSIYAAIILLVIRRDVPPKHQFRDLILFFVGLDLFYYVYIFIIELIGFISYKMNPLDPTLYIEMPFSRTLQEIGDFMKWTSIGLAAAVWAYVATKLRNLGKKVLYIIMLLPLFAVISIELVVGAFSAIMFFVTGGGMVVPDPSTGYDVRMYYDSQIASTLTSLTALVLCLYAFFKKPTAKKSHTQEAEIR